jgi:two-component system OmpR family sensor kinase
MSLRARLIVGLLALATVGLVVLAAITYAEQRNFLLDRVDQQARDGINVAGRPFGRGPRPGFDRGDRPPGGGLPADAIFYQRDPSGATIAWSFASPYSESSRQKAPALPQDLTTDKLVTIKDDGQRYRVLAEPSDEGGTYAVAIPLHDVDQTLNRLLLVEGLVILGILVAIGALAWWLVRIGLRPLDRMGVTAGNIAAGDLSHRVDETSPKTEVGRLGLSLNRMLDRLEEAFTERQASEDRLRRFLADASHELRTPLASIRGYAELFRIGAAREPADVEKAMTRIESEAARMGVLVEDLLTLARLDEVRDVIRGEVDLTRLAGDAVDDARATAPDRAIDLYAEGRAVVQGDPSQLRQVLANLLRNALVHTPERTSIEVTVRREGADAVELEVRDHGPGLPQDGTHPADAIFERFWRAEAGRERGRAGAGLGLAIVAGIVGAHGGTVHAADAPGGGARFTVRLPAIVTAERPPTGSTVPGS